MRVCLTSEDVVIKHVRRTYRNRITGLVDESDGHWSEGYHYRLRDRDGEEFLAELVDVDVMESKTRLTFEE